MSYFVFGVAEPVAESDTASFAAAVAECASAAGIFVRLADGFDDTFESMDCAASELEERLVQMVRTTGDHPSLLLRVSPRPDCEAAR